MVVSTYKLGIQLRTQSGELMEKEFTNEVFHMNDNGDQLKPALVFYYNLNPNMLHYDNNNRRRRAANGVFDQSTTVKKISLKSHGGKIRQYRRVASNDRCMLHEWYIDFRSLGMSSIIKVNL